MRCRIAITLLALLMVSNAPAFSRCACLDTPDEQARKAQDAAAISRLPSQSELELGRGFWAQGIKADAKQHMLRATEYAQKELSESISQQNAGAIDQNKFLLTARHAIQVQREVAGFLLQQADYADAAKVQETVLTSELQLSPQSVDEAQQYRLLSSLFQSAHNPEKAAEYQLKLAEHFARTKGRYSHEAKSAQAVYSAMVSQLRRSAVTTAGSSTSH